jgi:phosphoglycerate kinase
MSKLRTLTELLKQPSLVAGKRVLLRVDLNVPVSGGKVVDITRIERAVPSMRALCDAGAKVVVVSHFGRPKGEFRPDMSLAPIADALSEVLGAPVRFGVDCVGVAAKQAVEQLVNGQLVLLENLRFHQEEERNDAAFAEKLASVADIYVNDAFSCSHRAHASITAVTQFLPSYAGFLLEDEIMQLHRALDGAEKPVAAIVGGSKVSTKIDLLERLSQKVQYLMVGGGMANTFLYALGHDVGQSLCEPDKKETALAILASAKRSGCEFLLPVDAIVAETFAANVPCDVLDATHIPAQGMMLDVGPQTIHHWQAVLSGCKTVIWNGPLGAFELPPFNTASIQLARFIVARTHQKQLNSVAGGGDVLAALSQAGLRDRFSYISTAGGAFLEWLEGKELPGVRVLSQ